MTTYAKELSIDMLSAVQKPARYTGGEFGSIVKEKADVRMALAFPDVYEVGMSYLGFKILYHLLNKLEGVAAERVYAPWIDMEKLMRERGITLCTLETKQALAECDLVGFTLQYELSYTNILNMLDLGGVKVKAADRVEGDPFVVVGGPCVFNPEPLADFFDVAIIGEGEEALPELVLAYKKWKLAGCQGGRQGFLKLAAKLKGIYVPSFYEVQYKEDGTVAQVKPVQAEAEPVIYKRVVQDMNTVDYPDDPIVPFAEIVHDRIMLEVFRGCSRGCRFCNAGMVYRPVRERKPEVLRALARRLVDNTGYDEISLFSLSTADYSCLDPLLDGLMHDFKDERVSVSLPSLRIDSFCVDVAQKVNTVRKSGLTFAPEAGSQRMRDVINKGVTEQNLMDAVSAAFANGWKKIKLYFMIGLPYETDEDVLAIADLAKKVMAKYKEITGKGGAMVTVSVANFVPKPYTAFQWAPQDTLEEIKRKDLLLREAFRHVRGINYQYHESKVSVLEGVFARGDRRLGKALYYAWQKGERFDGWDDCFNYDLWQETFKATGIEPKFYASRTRTPEEIFPWEHLQPGVDKNFLAHEYAKAKAAQLTHDCRHGDCTGCGVCQKLGVQVIDLTKVKPEVAAKVAEEIKGDKPAVVETAEDKGGSK
jgi:radical SAM family uncharacterized protein